MAQDRVEIPVSLNLTQEITQVINQLKAQIQSQLAAGITAGLPGKISATGTQTFSQGGKEFEATIRSRLTKDLEGLQEAIAQGKDVNDYVQSLISIKEVLQKSNKKAAQSAQKTKSVAKDLEGEDFDVSTDVDQDAIRELRRRIRFFRSPKQLREILDALSDPAFPEDTSEEVRSMARRNFDRTRSLRSRRQRQIFSGVEERAFDLPFDDAIAEFQDYLQKGGPFRKRALQAIQRIEKAKRNATVSQAKQATIGKSLEEQAQIWQGLIGQPGEVGDLAFKQLTDVQKRQFAETKRNAAKDLANNKRVYTEFKQQIDNSPVAEQINLMEDFARNNQAMSSRARRDISKLRVKQRKQDFSTWFEGAQGGTLQQQVEDYDRFISAFTGTDDLSTEQLRRVRRERARILRKLEGDRANAARLHHQRFSGAILAAGGVGIGLFGQAGFPLLNVGFAAMSGGPLAAMAAGAATAIGETSRAIITLTESAKQSAVQLGFVSEQYRKSQNSLNAMNSVLTSFNFAVERISIDRRVEMYRERGMPAIELGGIFDVIKNGFKEAFASELSSGRIPTPTTLLRETILRSFELNKLGRAEALNEARDARRRLWLEMNQPYANLQEDPYQTWQRIQTAALDPLKAEERRVQQDLINKIDEWIRAIEGQTNNPPSLMDRVNGAVGAAADFADDWLVPPGIPTPRRIGRTLGLW